VGGGDELRYSDDEGTDGARASSGLSSVGVNFFYDLFELFFSVYWDGSSVASGLFPFRQTYF